MDMAKQLSELLDGSPTDAGSTCDDKQLGRALCGQNTFSGCTFNFK